MKQKLTQIEVFNYFMSKRDFDMAADLLHNDFTVQGKSKELFLQELRNCKNEFSGENDLVVVTGPCTCATHEGLYGTSYIDMQSNVFLNLVIQTKDGEIRDISRCHSFKKPVLFSSGRSICFSSVPTFCEEKTTNVF